MFNKYMFCISFQIRLSGEIVHLQDFTYLQTPVS